MNTRPATATHDDSNSSAPLLPRTLMVLDEAFTQVGDQYYCPYMWWRFARVLARHCESFTLYVPLRQADTPGDAHLVDLGTMRIVGRPYYVRMHEYYARRIPLDGDFKRRTAELVAEHDLVIGRMPGPAVKLVAAEAHRQSKPTVLFVAGDVLAGSAWDQRKSLPKRIIGSVLGRQARALENWVARRAAFVGVWDTGMRQRFASLCAHTHACQSPNLTADMIESRDDTCTRKPIRLLRVCRLSPVKNIEMLLDTMAELVSRGHDVALDIAGSCDLPDYKTKLDAKTATLKLTDRIHFLGGLDFGPALFDRYRAADIHVISSSWEGLPRCLAEGRAFGLPTVTTNVGGIASVVNHEQDGLLVEPDNASAMADAIERIITDGVLRRRIISRGLDRAQQSTAEFHAQRVAALIRDALRLPQRPVATTSLSTADAPRDVRWRRLLRSRLWPIYKYVDNIQRIPPRVILWRIYKRLIMERYWRYRAAKRPQFPAEGRRLSVQLGGNPTERAAAWLAGDGAKHYADQPNPAAIAALVKKHCPQDVERTLKVADEFFAGGFRLLEAKASVQLDDRLHPDWLANPLDDIEWPHALSRFRKYCRALSRATLYTGDPKYANYLLDLIDDWINKNPRGTNMTWSSMEISLRSMEWNAALYAMRGLPSLNADRVARIWSSMIQQLNHLRQLPEIELSDNHLIYNLGAIHISATVWPQFSFARFWDNWALPKFLHEMRRQHRDDGLNVEQSTHYHVQVARIYIESWWLMFINGRRQREMEPFIGRFIEVIHGMMRPDGTIPLFSDAMCSFFEDSGTADARTLLAWGSVIFDQPAWAAASGGLTEEAVWMLGERCESFEAIRARHVPSTRETQHHFLPDSGYYFARHEPEAAVTTHAAIKSEPHGSYLVVDAGPLGFPPVPAHGHPDTLSFEYWHDGRPIVIDPGTYEYEPGEWAYYFRRTRGHATVTVDEQDQATQWGFARWVDLPNWNRDSAGCDQNCFWLDAWHDGYARLAEPVRHRRRYCWLSPDLLVIEDLLTGDGAHTLEQVFPMSPTTRAIDSGDGVVSLRPKRGGELSLQTLTTPPGTAVEIIHGRKEDPLWGWSAANYGFCDPIDAVVFRSRSSVPARFVTVISPSRFKAVDDELWRSADGRFELTLGDTRGFAVVELADQRPMRLAAVDVTAVQHDGKTIARTSAASGWMIAACGDKGWRSAHGRGSVPTEYPTG